jgi:DNA helicase MCM8
VGGWGGGGFGFDAGFGGNRLEVSGFGGARLGLGGDEGGLGAGGPDNSLEMRLRRGVSRVKPEELLPPAALRKYVAFARCRCCPLLLPEAGVVLREFYRELRARHGSDEGMPITTRQLESLLRLSEARAKIELSEYVTRAHAEDVVELMRLSLFDAAMDDVGELDFSRLAGGLSKRKALTAVSLAIKRHEQQSGQRFLLRDELAQVLMRNGIPQGAGMSAHDLIDHAHESGMLLKRSGGYELMR